MDNLTQIIKEAFHAGFEASESMAADRRFSENNGGIHCGRSYQHYFDEFLKKVDEKLNPGCEDE